MPELKPCPNPKCPDPQHMAMLSGCPIATNPKDVSDGYYRIECTRCRMCGPQSRSADGACKGWNALPREAKAEPVEPARKCPYCGGRADWTGLVGNTMRHWVCDNPNCLAVSPMRHTAPEAYKAWWKPFKAAKCVACGGETKQVCTDPMCGQCDHTHV